jgi:hypothetical protein
VSGLSEQECSQIVRASIDPGRLLAGPDGYEGSEPDVLLVTVQRILADRLAAHEAREERARALAKEWLDAGVTRGGEYPHGIAQAEDMCAYALLAVLDGDA